MDINWDYVVGAVVVAAIIYFIVDSRRDKRKDSHKTPYNSEVFVIKPHPDTAAYNKLTRAWNKLPDKYKKFCKQWANGAQIDESLKTGNYGGLINYRTTYIKPSSLNWLSSTIYHEAAHNYIRYNRSDLAGKKTAIEKLANSMQADVLNVLGEHAMAQKLRAADGTHWQHHNW